MLNFIDTFLNKTTMYRLVLYVLAFFFVASLLLSFLKLLPYTPADIILSASFILFISWITNIIFAYVFEAPTNVESVYISALILFFIITPIQLGNYSEFLPLAFWASVWAMSAKFIFAVGKKHIFNPVAIAVVITSLFINQSASWWIGTFNMLPFVIVGGLLVVRKIRRTDLVISYIISTLITIIVITFERGADIPSTILRTITESSFLFFAFIMLTEPLTTPPTKFLRIVYGAFVGFLSAPNLHLLSIYFTPELALVLGNLFSYAVSPKEKLILTLKEKIKVATDTFDFIFTSNKNFNFKPGQYMEWTLAHRDPDSRGNRRFFTVASSPTENEVHLGVKFYPEPSSFKNHLVVLPVGGQIIASQQAGEFILPKKKEQGLVFIAGGIGVTPFRSMIQSLLDKKEKRNITLLYSNKTVADIAYKNIFDRAESELGIKTVYYVTEANETLSGDNMQKGFISGDTIKRDVKDYISRKFYISGPHSMVSMFGKILTDIGVPKKNIKTDFFPGFA